MAIDADQLTVLKHRDAEYGPISGEIDGGDDNRITLDVGLHRPDVSEMDHLLCGGQTPKNAVGRRSD